LKTGLSRLHWQWLLFSIAAFVLALPPFSLFPLAFVMLVPLGRFFEKAREQSLSLGWYFLNGWFWGFWFSAFTLFWIVHVTSIGLVPLFFVEGALYGVIFWITAWFGRRYHNPALISLILVLNWAVMDYLRSLTIIAFPWNLLGSPLHAILPFIQIADIGGVWLVGFWVGLINWLFYLLWRGFYRRRIVLSILILLITLCGGYGLFRLNTLHYDLSSFKIGLIQGNIDQDQKWNRGFIAGTFSKYARLSRKAAEQGADLIVWPETAATCYLRYHSFFLDSLANLARELKRPIYTGSLDFFLDSAYNAAFGIDTTGRIIFSYNKINLVPFGERIPFSDHFPILNTFDFGQGSFNYGREMKLAEFQGKKFPTLICYEIIFPELTRNFVNLGADFIVNITNDAWFGRYSAPEQHAFLMPFRAIENRIGIARVANTGYTFFVDPDGSVNQLTHLFQDTVVVREIALKNGATLYEKWGDWAPWLCLCGLALLSIVAILFK